jgi:hypothetical protein
MDKTKEKEEWACMGRQKERKIGGKKERNKGKE